VERNPVLKNKFFKKNRVNTLKYVFVLVNIAFLGACASMIAPIPEKASDGRLFVSTPQAQSDVAENHSAAYLIHEGVDNLGGPGKAPDYDRARAAFESLLRTFPDSHWRSLAELLIRLVDNIQSYEEMAIFDQRAIDRLKGDKNKLIQENEQLKKEVRMWSDKVQSETARLIQENDQLKQDIEQLKKLDIELDKRREKMNH
jgi:hypothetical protein